MEERVNELLPLAAKIAREFSNIPGLPHAEIDLAAQETLANAARHFDPAKGDYHAMMNAMKQNQWESGHEVVNLARENRQPVVSTKTARRKTAKLPAK